MEPNMNVRFIRIITEIRQNIAFLLVNIAFLLVTRVILGYSASLPRASGYWYFRRRET